MEFADWIPTEVVNPEHFRAALELQGVCHEKRGFLIGARDDYFETGDNTHFSTKSLFFGESRGRIEDSWISNDVKIGGGYVGGINFGIKWRPSSNILNWEFEGLWMRLHLKGNLIGRVTRIKFSLDHYEFLDKAIDPTKIEKSSPSLGRPDQLTVPEEASTWKGANFGHLDFRLKPDHKPDFVNSTE